MFGHSDKSADERADGKTIQLTMMGPTCGEWTTWPLAQRHAYLRGYLEAELFYRGLMSFQWKGKFGPAIDRAIAHVDFNWPTPARTLNEEERAITTFYGDPRNQHVLFFPARRCILLQIAGYPPSVVEEAILKARKKSYDDPDFRDRILRRRSLSLEELETLSASRGLDEEESWSLAHLTARKKGPDAALPLLDTLIASYPMHAQAFLLRGQLLLARNDASGIKDIERSLEIDPTSLAEAYDLIAEFFHRQRDPESAETYAGLALRYRTIETAAESERISIENDDVLVPHDLSDEVLEVLREQIRQIPEIAVCYLAKKAVRFFVDRDFYLLGVVTDAIERPSEWDRKSTDLMMRIKRQLILPEYTYVVVFDESLRILQEKTQALASSNFYTRAA
jgi:tetratricopeptide (TPR) repeat protein